MAWGHGGTQRGRRVDVPSALRNDFVWLSVSCSNVASTLSSIVAIGAYRALDVGRSCREALERRQISPGLAQARVVGGWGRETCSSPNQRLCTPLEAAGRHFEDSRVELNYAGGDESSRPAQIPAQASGLAAPGTHARYPLASRVGLATYARTARDTKGVLSKVTRGTVAVNIDEHNVHLLASTEISTVTHTHATS